MFAPDAIGWPMRLFSIAVILMPTPALAHWGHVGEVAAHSHWIALGALVAAGALAGAIAKGNSDAESDDADTDEGDAEEATA